MPSNKMVSTVMYSQGLFVLGMAGRSEPVTRILSRQEADDLRHALEVALIDADPDFHKTYNPEGKR